MLIFWNLAYVSWKHFQWATKSLHVEYRTILMFSVIWGYSLHNEWVNVAVRLFATIRCSSNFDRLTQTNKMIWNISFSSRLVIGVVIAHIIFFHVVDKRLHKTSRLFARYWEHFWKNTSYHHVLDATEYNIRVAFMIPWKMLLRTLSRLMLKKARAPRLRSWSGCFWEGFLLTR